MFAFLGFLLAKDTLNPIYEGISNVGPYALAVVSLLSLFYGIMLGVKYAQADSEEKKRNLHQTLINFIIGAVTIIILISILYAIREPLANWMSS